MKRQVIKIDEEKCNGCGLCVSGCAEGALQMVDGKARLVSDLHCDGLGACLGECPQGAISFDEREAEQYDEARTIKENIIPKGENMIRTHLKHLYDHGQADYFKQACDVLKERGIEMSMESIVNGGQMPLKCGCPGSMTVDRTKEASTAPSPSISVPVSSQLRQWPVQMHLLNPHAPFFKEADLLIAADCVPFAYANFHNRFLKDRVLLIFCPKLDNSRDVYIEKLTEILKANRIKSITVARMEVPCCGGTLSIAEEAIRKSGVNVVLKEYTISLNGDII